LQYSWGNFSKNEKGYRIIGIDFSKRSINYAVNKASERGQDIRCIYQNYLELDYTNEFDLVTLIDCDLVVLLEEESATLLEKIYESKTICLQRKNNGDHMLKRKTGSSCAFLIFDDFDRMELQSYVGLIFLQKS